MACNTCGYRKGHMAGCPEGQSSGGQGRKKNRRTGGTCNCNCGHYAGEVINGVKQRWAGGCRGAKAHDPHAAHCGRPKCRGDELLTCVETAGYDRCTPHRRTG